MKVFLRKSLKWLLFLLFTLAFFSLPIYLQKEEKNSDFRRTQPATGSPGAQLSSTFYFEFDPGSLKQRVSGDSTALSVSTISDSAAKYVYLYVNGKKQDMAVVSDTMRVEFPRVYLQPGANEIAVVLQDRRGKVLAVRKTNIFSSKKT